MSNSKDGMEKHMTKFYAGIGSRETPKDICKKMTNIAKFLNKQDFILRSGGAPGADSAFESGAGNKKEIFLPYKGFNGNKSNRYHLSEEAFELAGKFHPAWNYCKDYARKFHARNCYQVLGENLDDPVQFVVCWTKNGKIAGGTGQALRIAESMNIPICNLFTVVNFEKWFFRK